MEKQEAIEIIKDLKPLLNYRNLFREFDPNAGTENFVIEFQFSDVIFFLPNDDYPKYQLSFLDTSGSGCIEEFFSYTEAVDYLIEQVENDCI